MRNLTLGATFLLTLSLVTIPVYSQQAGTCTATNSCPTPPIHLQPGSSFTLEIINRTRNPVEFQQLNRNEPFTLPPRQTQVIFNLRSTKPNFSLLFWDNYGDSIEARLFQIAPNRLKLELLPSGISPQHSTLYIDNDGTPHLN